MNRRSLFAVLASAGAALAGLSIFKPTEASIEDDLGYLYRHGRMLYTPDQAAMAVVRGELDYTSALDSDEPNFAGIHSSGKKVYIVDVGDMSKQETDAFIESAMKVYRTCSSS